jgi:hypothetical protein
MKARIVSIAILSLLSAQAFAQTVIYEQTGLLTTDRGAYQHYNQQLADDFVPGTDGTVTTVTWQGSYYGTDNPATVESFTIQFFTDDAGLPTNTPFYEVVMDAPKTAVGSLINKTLYEYSVDLAAGPELLSGQTYWLNIYTNDSPINYAWANSTDGTLGGAIRAQDNPWEPLTEAERDNHVFTLEAAEGPEANAAEYIPVPIFGNSGLVLLILLISAIGLMAVRRY